MGSESVITKAELDEGARLEGAATDGPWFNRYHRKTRNTAIESVPDTGNIGLVHGGLDADCKADADIIVWLRNNAKALIAEAHERQRLADLLMEREASAINSYRLEIHKTVIDKANDDLHAEVARLRKAIKRANGELEYDCSEDAQERAVALLEQALADGQGETMDDLDYIRLIERHKYDRRQDYDRIKALGRVLGEVGCGSCDRAYSENPIGVYALNCCGPDDCADAEHNQAYELLKGGE